MSNISTIYDQIYTVIGNLFSSKTKIPMPYSLEDNPEMFLRDGYGLKVGSSTDFDDSEFHAFMSERVFSIVFSRELLRTDSSSDTLDTTVKNLLEDANTLQKDFLNVDQIEISSSIENIGFNGCSDVEMIKQDKAHFLSIEVEFTFTIKENL